MTHSLALLKAFPHSSAHRAAQKIRLNLKLLCRSCRLAKGYKTIVIAMCIDESTYFNKRSTKELHSVPL